MPKKTRNPLAVGAKAIDPTLDALFASSAGPVVAPAKSRYSALLERKSEGVKSKDVANGEADDGDDDDDEVLSEISEELDYGDEDENDEISDSDDEEASSETSKNAEESESESLTDQGEEVPSQAVVAALEATEGPRKERKRKRKSDNEDLEGKYLDGLSKDEEPEPTGKRPKVEDEAAEAQGEGEGDEDEDEDDGAPMPAHESLSKDDKVSEIEKAARTVFIGNVSSEAITSKTAKKTLMNHLSSVLGKEASASPEKLESIRFRSVAFSSGAMPKRASYITGSVMDATTKSTNAYAVFSSPAAARRVVEKLNGSEILGRHIRVDSIAHPSPMDHRRCVFVGNLGFVDDETVINQNADGETVEKKRHKVPSDVEEGLWRQFGAKGVRVENVRVVRDAKTRVGKGFAYVQFYDANDVEGALLLDGKKFPPMLPRALRVTRAKDPRKTTLAQERSKSKSGNAKGALKNMKYKPKVTPEQHAAAGRAGKLLGRSGAAQQQRFGNRLQGPGSTDSPKVVYEGKRATVNDALSKDLKMKSKGKGKGKPKGRGAKRAAAWRKKS